jgi:hypothetical protein
MKVKLLDIFGTWKSVKNACRTTINKCESDIEPTSEWKRRLLMSEHSPLRKININWIWTDLPYWVSVHLVRHNVGCTPFVGTQRDDRNDYGEVSRNSAPQDTPVQHEEIANMQAIINISRKRLCNCASKETREAWQLFLDEVVKPTEPELYKTCVKECVYRNGLCPEFISCGYNKTNKFKKELRTYIKGFENQICDKTLIGKEGDSHN